MATDATGHHLPGMANYAKNVTACVPFQRAPVAEEEVGHVSLFSTLLCFLKWGSNFAKQNRRCTQIGFEEITCWRSLVLADSWRMTCVQSNTALVADAVQVRKC